VAYVDAVNPDGSILVEEYNARARPNDHTYGTRTLRPGSTSWPSEFLHVKDLTPPPPPPPPPTSGDSTATVRADFNGDGRDDVLVVSPRGPSGLNFVPLLSTGTAFTHGGLWWNTGTDYTLDVVRLVAGDFNGDNRSDVLVATPRGPSGLNFVPLLSTGSAFVHGGLWFNTGTDYTLDQIRLAAGDFNGDRKSDVLLVTPRGSSGLNFVPLLSAGSAFTHGGLWYNTGTELTLDVLKLAAGDFNGDGRSDVLLVTPRGPSGLNFVSLLSSGASAFVHGGLWFNTGTELTLDVLKLATGDFNGDGNGDVLLVTPRGPSGLNFVPLLSNGGSAFVHGGLWFNTGTELSLDVKLAAGDFNADRRDDVLLVTPRGPSGLNFVPLQSAGTAFSYGGLWFDTGTDYAFDQIKLV
jgi:FG-GAP-like repeat/FG-GAP repeat